MTILSRNFCSIICILLGMSSSQIGLCQKSFIKGQLSDDQGASIAYANLFLFQTSDSVMVKAELSDESGNFHFGELASGHYYIRGSYVGYEDFTKNGIEVGEKQELNLGKLLMAPKSTQLKEAVVSAKRTILEVKPDRTVFNVEGTINSIGNDGMSLLRKAPGVNVDNNDNVSLLGRSGVLIYVDGKRIPLGGQELSNYLQSLQAEQIDRIEIISNPGAKYEAQGNAGIIDIRLKRDKNFGTNGTAGLTYIQGRYPKVTLSGNANYRDQKWNVFGNTSLTSWKGYNYIAFESFQNDLFLIETLDSKVDRNSINYRVGTDYFLSKNHTLGILASGNLSKGEHPGYNEIYISKASQPNVVDSILAANTNVSAPRNNQTYNINYKFESGQKRSLNIDLDYGFFDNKNLRDQLNEYYDATKTNRMSFSENSFFTPSEIDIWTFKMDYEQDFWGTRLGTGFKYSDVNSHNVFHVYETLGRTGPINERRSNIFDYDEKVYATYLTLTGSFDKKWKYAIGLRAEQSDIRGDLQAYLPELQEPPVDLSYLSFFPNAGITWNYKPDQSFQLSYGRRINRPDYQVLNPFVNQLSQLSFEKGNPFLDPEIVNNIELSYTLMYKYNFKLGYSHTADQITRLIGPDDSDPRASFIKWDNLAERKTYNFSASLPFEFSKIWEAYFNFGASHIHNLADYGDGAVVDLKAYTYNLYQQHSFKLPWGWKAEISNYFSGPGIWGGVFLYETSWSLDIGFQKKFFNERMSFKISGNDIFYQSGWSGESNFDGLYSTGKGNWDSRRLTVNLSYRFGNENVKSRRRTTGLESEAGRVGSGN
ncbi:MAG: TonB-dependent receptor [Saprospiraceae bacterium]|nr:TonB-dependent receptor [Saprospiraceae bacterium]